MLAAAKDVGHLHHGERPRRRHQDIQQDLVAGAGQAPDRRVEGVPLQHEEAAHRVGDLGAQHEARQPRGHIADQPPRLAPVAGAACPRVARADHDIAVGLTEPPQHLGELALVVLQVGVHDGDIGRAGGENSLDHRRRQSAPADALQMANTGIGAGQIAQHLEGAVGEIIVDEHDLPIDAGEAPIDALHELAYVVVLVEGGDDDRKQRPAPKRVVRRCRVQGLCRQHGGIAQTVLEPRGDVAGDPSSEVVRACRHRRVTVVRKCSDPRIPAAACAVPDTQKQPGSQLAMDGVKAAAASCRDRSNSSKA